MAYIVETFRDLTDANDTNRNETFCFCDFPSRCGCSDDIVFGGITYTVIRRELVIHKYVASRFMTCDDSENCETCLNSLPF